MPLTGVLNEGMLKREMIAGCARWVYAVVDEKLVGRRCFK